MKSQYEHRARQYLPRRTYTIIRLDGKAFHTYTRELNRPYDERLLNDVIATAEFLCRELGGARLAYAQSDEISVLLTDFDRKTTQAWFDGNVQKMVSVSASLATARFNELRPGRLAFFDARAFTIPDRVEVVNYLVWRQQDATRNSISMAAQAHLSHRELHGRSTDEMQELLWQTHGVNWNDYDARFRRGTVVTSHLEVGDVEYTDPTGEVRTAVGVERRVWRSAAPPVFTAEPAFLDQCIPRIGGNGDRTR